MSYPWGGECPVGQGRMTGAGDTLALSLSFFAAFSLGCVQNVPFCP